MKKWKQRSKCGLAFLIALIMIMFAFQGVEKTEVMAMSIKTDASDRGQVANGDFESGRVGYSVRGWSMIPTDINKGELSNLDSYKNNFYLKTAEDQDGNKVAELAKFASGYMAMVSQEIDVSGSEDYYLSVDYYLKEINIDIDTSTGEPATSGNKIFPLSFFVEEIDANGNAQRKEGDKNRAQDENYEEASTEWSTFHLQFQTEANTKKIRIYCWLGGEWNVNETVWLDNVTLSKRSNGEVINGDFESSRVGNSIRGWTKIGLDSDSTGNYVTEKTSWGSNYTMQTMKYGDSRVAALSKVGGGYAALKSDPIPVGQEKTYCLEADWLVKDVVATDTGFNGVHFQILQKNANGTESVLYQSQRLNPDKINKDNPSMTNWRHVKITFTTTKEAESVRIIYLNHATWNTKNTALLDNVTVIPQDGDGMTNWTMESCDWKGATLTDKNYTKNYGCVKTNGGIGYEDTLQLYVKRADGTLGGVGVYSEPIQIEKGQTYITSFDMKMEGYNATEDNGVIWDRRVVLRYLNADGEVINGAEPQVLTKVKQNINWTNYKYTVIPPTEANFVQIGLLIGSNQMNLCKDMTHSFANLVFLEESAYEDFQKDPAVTSSSLYKQSALFVGDSIGNTMAQQAASYSEMRVTNACGDTSPVAEQLKQYQGEMFDYVFISGGKMEQAASMSAGVVSADNIYMDGMDFDTTTFAGTLEYTFGKVAEYYNQPKVVYILTTANTTYRTIAQQAASKWNVQLVMLGESTDSWVNWNDTIEPAEQAKAFDCYEIKGLADYLEKRVDEIVGTGLTITSDISALETVKEKANNCPKSNVDYDKFQNLAERIGGILEQVQGFRPSILGATIATNNPNVLSFIGVAPQSALTEGVQVKAMGILSIPAEYLDASMSGYKTDATLELGNQYVRNMEVRYVEALQEFRVSQEGLEADPYTEYTAIAYIIYEANNQDYVFYSANDYTNSVGVQTVSDGRCTKSVFGIAQKAATQLAKAKELDMDFTAIGGEGNVLLIPTATEESEVSLKDVYRLICNNKKVLAEWLDEGGFY